MYLKKVLSQASTFKGATFSGTCTKVVTCFEQKTEDWAPVWYRLSLKRAVFDYLRFYEIKFQNYKRRQSARNAVLIL